MKPHNINDLLNQPESATVDFKQVLKIYVAGNGRQRERDELRRDILALANGNPHTVAENKYLIIGRADKPNPNGIYELFDIGDQYPTADDLLKLMTDVAYPPLNAISSELLTVEGKRLLVITIPPTEYVHETTKVLKTPKRDYTEYTVFMRRDESIAVASASDRAAIRRAKQRYFDEREGVPPTQFGAGLGAFLVGPMVGQQAKKAGFSQTVQIYTTVFGGLVGALVGGMYGSAYKDYRSFGRDWPDLSPTQKTAVASFISVLTAVFAVLWKKLFSSRPEKVPGS